MAWAGNSRSWDGKDSVWPKVLSLYDGWILRLYPPPPPIHFILPPGPLSMGQGDKIKDWLCAHLISTSCWVEPLLQYMDYTVYSLHRNLAKFFAFSDSNFCFYSQFWHLHRHYILATRAKFRPGKNQPEIPHRPYTTVECRTRADNGRFRSWKYDDGVKKPSQSIKIYRKSLKSLQNVIN